MSEFKFIPKKVEEKNLETKDTFTNPLLLEIAHQLRRIADKLK